MAFTASEETPNLKLPQWLGSDTPAVREDFNQSFQIIDTAVTENKNAISGTTADITSLKNSVNQNVENIAAHSNWFKEFGVTSVPTATAFNQRIVVLENGIVTITDNIDEMNNRIADAQNTAAAASETATDAAQKAEAAVTTANRASSNADTAVSQANTALTTAQAAKTAAGNATDTANAAQTAAGNAQTAATNAMNRANEVNTNLSNAMKTWTDFQVTINTSFPGYESSRQYCTGNKALNMIKLGITIDASASVSGTQLVATLPAGWRPASTITLQDMFIVRTLVGPSSDDNSVSFHSGTIDTQGRIYVTISSRYVYGVHLLQMPIMTNNWGF